VHETALAIAAGECCLKLPPGQLKAFAQRLCIAGTYGQGRFERILERQQGLRQVLVAIADREREIGCRTSLCLAEVGNRAIQLALQGSYPASSGNNAILDAASVRGRRLCTGCVAMVKRISKMHIAH
jgi:hypothetical protein